MEYIVQDSKWFLIKTYFGAIWFGADVYYARYIEIQNLYHSIGTFFIFMCCIFRKLGKQNCHIGC